MKRNIALVLALLLVSAMVMVPVVSLKADAAHVHTRVYTVNPIPGNCVTRGRVYWNHYCSTCGVGLGTSWDYTSYGSHSYYTVTAASCTSSGLSRCSICGATQTIPQTAHRYCYSRDLRYATKYSTGLRAWYCSCGKQLSVVTTPKLS